MPSTYNQIFYEAPGKLIKVNDATNEFIVSGYRLIIDPNLNRDLLLVNTPQNTGAIGQKGNIAFDQNHIYYCYDTNSWARGRLAHWGQNQDNIPIPMPLGSIPIPSNWWNLTLNGNDNISNYNFINPTNVGLIFDPADGFKNPISPGCLLNYSTNIVEPSTKNEDFSISFEVKRVNNGFLMGSPYGKLGFHFEFVNANNTSSGPYISFALGAHAPISYRWVRAISASQISNLSFAQIVATNDSINKQIKLYVNGALEATTSYASQTLASLYNNPAFKGWGIGSSPNGSFYSIVSSTEFYSSSNIRYMGFWVGQILKQDQITALYNGGSFKRYPFV